MKKLLALISTLVVVPVYAVDYAQPAAAQPSTSQPTTNQPAAPQAAASAAPAAQAQSKSMGTVARAQFTNAIQDREPVDKVSTLLNDKNRLYFFSEIKDASDQKITHRWEHDGKVVSETSFDIGGNRWRVYSNKTLDPNQTGEWKVSVVDEAGHTLGTNTFTYEAAKAPSQPAAPTANQPAAPAAAATQ